MGLFDKIKKAGSDSLNNLTSKINLESLGEISSKINKESLSNLASKINAENTKAFAVQNVCKINYSKSLESAEKMSKDIPGVTSLCQTLIVLRDSSNEYNNSDSPTKENEFIQRLTSEIDAEKVADDIDPILEYVPNGNLIKMALKYIAKKQKKKT